MKLRMLLVFLFSITTTSQSAFSLEAWQGQQKALVLLMHWSNTNSEISMEHLDDTFFGEGRGTKSLNAFFDENAQGKFRFDGKVMNWRQSRRSWSASSSCNLRTIVQEAWNVFGADVNIADYDSDGNGKIDNLFVIHSGRINSDRVGPECTFTNYSKADFSIVFQSQGLGSIGSAIAVGFYIHEGGHGYYNLPDLYGDHYRGRYGIGMWGMMGLGAWGVRNDIGRDDLFRYPAQFEPLSKIRIGWVQPRVITETTRGVEIRAVESTNDIVAVPRTSGSNYYLEYRSTRGFSENHHGHGLLIWKNYDIIQADGRDDINNGTALGYRPLPPIDENFGDASDPFPGEDGVTFYEDRRYGVRFENIVQYDDKIVLDIVVNGKKVYTEPMVPLFNGHEKL